MKIVRINNKEHTVFHLNDREAEIVATAIKAKQTFVKVRGVLFNVKKELEFFGEEKPDILQRNLSGQRCVGQYSIQNEISHIAKSLGKEWPRLIIDKAWRKKTYDKLYTQSGEWCDYLKGTCYCDPEFLNNPFSKPL